MHAEELIQSFLYIPQRPLSTLLMRPGDRRAPAVDAVIVLNAGEPVHDEPLVHA